MWVGAYLIIVNQTSGKSTYMYFFATGMVAYYQAYYGIQPLLNIILLLKYFCITYRSNCSEYYLLLTSEMMNFQNENVNVSITVMFLLLSKT